MRPFVTGLVASSATWRTHSCVPCRDSPGTSAQTIGNKEAAAPRFLAPETFPAGIVPRSSRHAGQHDSRRHRDESVSMLHTRVCAPRLLWRFHRLWWPRAAMTTDC